MIAIFVSYHRNDEMDPQQAYANVLEIQFIFAQSPIMPHDKHRAYIENLEASLRTIENAQELLAQGLNVGSTAEELQISYDDTLCLLIQMREIEARWSSSTIPPYNPDYRPPVAETRRVADPPTLANRPSLPPVGGDSFLYDRLSRMPGYRSKLKEEIPGTTIVIWSIVTINISGTFIFPRTSSHLLDGLDPKYFPPAPGLLASYFNSRMNPEVKDRIVRESSNDSLYLHEIGKYFMELPTALLSSGRKDKEERRERKRMVHYIRYLYYKGTGWMEILHSFDNSSAEDHPYLVVLLIEVGQQGLGALMGVLTEIVNNRNVSPVARALAGQYRGNVRDLMRYYPEDEPQNLYKLVHYNHDTIEKVMAGIAGSTSQLNALEPDDLTYLHHLNLI